MIQYLCDNCGKAVGPPGARDIYLKSKDKVWAVIVMRRNRDTDGPALCHTCLRDLPLATQEEYYKS